LQLETVFYCSIAQNSITAMVLSRTDAVFYPPHVVFYCVLFEPILYELVISAVYSYIWAHSYSMGKFVFSICPYYMGKGSFI
jgi:hypothetical protein